MDTNMHKPMASIANLEKIEIIRSQEFMLSEVRLKFLKKMIILGPKTAILGPHFWWLGAWAPPGSTPDWHVPIVKAHTDQIWSCINGQGSAFSFTCKG